MPSPSISWVTRLGTMILDHFSMCLVMMLPVIPFLIYAFANSFSNDPANAFEVFTGPLTYTFILGFALYFCKDSINGRSIAKRITKLQVVNNSTGRPASPFQCMIRNLFILIWPVEVAVSLFNPERRIGDRVAGTRLKVFESGEDEQRTKLVPIILALASALLICALLINLLPIPVQTRR